MRFTEYRCAVIATRENNQVPKFTSVLLTGDKKKTLDTIKTDATDIRTTRTPRLSPLVPENGKLSGYFTVAVAVATLWEIIRGGVRDTVTKQVQITLLATQVLNQMLTPSYLQQDKHDNVFCTFVASRFYLFLC